MIFHSSRTTRIPEVPLHEAAFFNIRDHENKVAVVDDGTGRSFTYSQLAEAVRRFASALTRQGIKKGDVIGFYSPNSAEYCVALLGCLSAGAIFSGINPNYTEYELLHHLSDSNTKALLTISANLTKVKEVSKKHSLKFVLTFDQAVPSCLYFEDFLRDDGSAYPSGLSFNVHEDLAAVLYSSGTTGLPKGVMLTHYNLVTSVITAVMSDLAPKAEDGGQGVGLGFVPFFHVYGMTLFHVMLTAGSKLAILSSFHPETFLGAIQKYKTNILYLVPPVVLFLAKSPLVDQYDISTVSTVFCGAAPLTKELENEFLSRFSISCIRQGFGMTETSSAVTVIATNQPKSGSAGKLVPNTMAKVVDPSSNKELSVGEEGELCFSGPLMMKGYLNKPKATSNTIDKDGWLHTGDLGYFDKDGDIFITGRIKELIKHKGFQVAPAEVEGLIMTHPGVDDAAVVGIPDQAAGELPRAFVVRKPQSNVTTQEIADFVKARLSRHKWLSGGVQFVSAIPKTASGKIVRRDVMKMLTHSKI